jgi:hypothetical protein
MPDFRRLPYFLVIHFHEPLHEIVAGKPVSGA